jgi:hypothetical protein
VAEVLTTSKEKTKAILNKIWDKSTEELFNEVDQDYELLIKVDKEQVKNDRGQNERIRNQALRLEELWKRGQLTYNQDEICEKITERLAEKNASKYLRSIVARQLDKRFKRKYTKADGLNVTAVTISHNSNEHSQSRAIFEDAKSNISYLTENFDHLTHSDMQDLDELLSKAKNKSRKHCEENNILTIETDSFESNLDRDKKQAKGKPISCPTPEGWEQKDVKTDSKSDNEIIESFRTLKAKAIYRYSMMWREIAKISDNYPAELAGDDEFIAMAFNKRSELLECYTDIKVKRDKLQWLEIIKRFQEISKHNAAAADELDVYGVTCSGCGARMKVIDKKRDSHRLYWRCPNYYRTEPQFIKCKLDEPVKRGVSKERIVEIQPSINEWAADMWRTDDVLNAFLYDFRNYKQPYHTDHTKRLEPKFQARGSYKAPSVDIR